MQLYTTYWMWTTGTYTVSWSVGLNPNNAYLVTGFLTQTNGSDYAHVYISTVCTESGDQVLCGVRDISDDTYLNINEYLYRANRVTIKLRTTGGRHRAEGVIYQL